MDLFWRIEIMMYSNIGEGVLKKQMKFVSNTKEELQQIQEKLSLESSIVNQEIISFHDEFSSRLKFRDIRKISIGICSKDLLTKAKKKSAFYNCVVLIVRVRNVSVFKEYHVKVFNTGKMEIPGIQCAAEFDRVTECVFTILGMYVEGGLQMNKDETDTVLINSNFNCGFYINRDAFYEILQKKYMIQSVYDPCSYPGIQCKFYFNSEREIQTGLQEYEDIKGRGYGYKKGLNLPKNKILDKKESKYTEMSLMIFRTGSVLIVGMCTEVVLKDVYDFLCGVLTQEYSQIRQQGDHVCKAPKKKGGGCKKKRVKHFIRIH